MKEELRPRLRFAITMPSNACRRFLSPSTTLTFTTTVSPGEKAGSSFLRRLISSCSSVRIRSMALAPVFPLEFLQQLRFLCAQGPRCEQVGPSEPGPAQRLLHSPAADVLMVSGHPDLGQPATCVN